MPENDNTPPMPFRLLRGKRILLVMATIIVITSLWEVLNFNFVGGWGFFHWQLLRFALPLGMIYRIFQGSTWTRYVLGIYSVLLLCINLPMLNSLPRMVQKPDFWDAGFVIVLLGGYLIIGYFSFFSQAITGLLRYRRDQYELDL